jgi:hypothetical protein
VAVLRIALDRPPDGQSAQLSRICTAGQNSDNCRVRGSC